MLRSVNSTTASFVRHLYNLDLRQHNTPAHQITHKEPESDTTTPNTVLILTSASFKAFP